MHRERETIAVAVAELAAGRPVVLCTGEHGDVVIAAQTASAQAVNFMATHARGIVSLGLAAERVEKLRLRPMSNDFARGGSAATRSVEARCGITTGISAHERAHTLRVAAAPEAQAEDLTSPGHVFPLRAIPDANSSAAGRVEAAVELVRRTGLQPAAAICGILDDRGDAARAEALVRFGERHGLTLVRTESVLAELRRSLAETRRTGVASCL